MSNLNEVTDFNELATFDELPKSYPHITKNQIEWLYRKREVNGFESAFCKIGKRRYVIKTRLLQIVAGG